MAAAAAGSCFAASVVGFLKRLIKCLNSEIMSSYEERLEEVLDMNIQSFHKVRPDAKFQNWSFNEVS